MHFLLLGASGRSGQLILQDALFHNHTITALVRNPNSLTPNPNISIVQGTPTNKSDIEKAILSTPTPPSAIIIALASLRATDSPFSKPVSPPRLMTDSHVAALSIMQKHGIKRLITMSAFGVGNSNPSVFLPMRLILNHSPMAFGFEDHNALEKVVRETNGVDWTLVRPTMLTDGEQKEVTVFGDTGTGLGMFPSVSRKSVARFVIGECLGAGKWVGRTPVIAN